MCTDEYRRLKQARDRKNSVKYCESEFEEKLYPDAKLLGVSMLQIFSIIIYNYNIIINLRLLTPVHPCQFKITETSFVNSPIVQL